MNSIGFLNGLIMGFGLIVAIGAQNVFVIKQGVKGQHILAVALTAALCDISLIILGIAGIGSLIKSFDGLFQLMLWIGVTFLCFYGFLALRNALSVTPKGWSSSENRLEKSPETWPKAVAVTLGFSLLNPHVYLDTLVLLGAIGASQPQHQVWSFAFGACVASALWFFSIAYLGRLLSPLIHKTAVVRGLELLVASIMFYFAAMLAFDPLH